MNVRFSYALYTAYQPVNVNDQIHDLLIVRLVSGQFIDVFRYLHGTLIGLRKVFLKLIKDLGIAAFDLFILGQSS